MYNALVRLPLQNEKERVTKLDFVKNRKRIEEMHLRLFVWYVRFQIKWLAASWNHSLEIRVFIVKRKFTKTNEIVLITFMTGSYQVTKNWNLLLSNWQDICNCYLSKKLFNWNVVTSFLFATAPVSIKWVNYESDNFFLADLSRCCGVVIITIA